MTEQEIFFEAIEIQSADARDAYLRGACGHDVALRRKLDQLLAEHYSSDSLLAGPAVEDITALEEKPLSEGPGTVIGRYKLLQQIGEGGMGVVYMAEQTEPVTRKVALKIIKLGMDTKQVVARFEAERQALAMMDHPNIAKVLDAGATDTGRPYFVMELVRGVPITEYCDKNKLSTQERLELFIPVCQAIQHAHQKGIIHRDIKPSNVMVTLHDGHAVPKVIDFGIAKATNQKLTEKTLFTNYAQMIGTPAYMSPEQAEMSGLDVDTRTDVYSLGVLLYELLTGSTPFPSKELLSMGYGEMQKVIAEKEPPKPSTRLSTMQHEELTVTADKRSAEGVALRKQFQGDLDWIVMKALEKDRTHRYETVNGLVADIRRHLDNEPVSAAAPTFSYQLHKFYRRNRRYMRVAAAIAGLLVLATAFATFQAIRATKAEQEALSAKSNESEQRAIAVNKAQEAEEARQDAEREQEAAVKSAEAANTANAEAQAARRQADDQAEALKQNLYFQNIALAYEEMSANQPAHALKLLDDCPEDLRGWEWDHVRHRSIAAGQPATTFPDPIYWMTVSTNGQDVAFISNQLLQVAKLTTAGTLKEIQVLGAVPPPLFEGQPWCAFSADARFLAAVSTNGMATLWNMEDRTLKDTFGGNTNGIDAIAFHPTGEEIAVAKKDDETISIFKVSSLDPRLQIPLKRLCSALVYSPDGQWLAAGTGEREICIWESSSGSVVKKLSYPSPVQGLAFSPDGHWLAGGGGTTLKLWEVSNWNLAATLEGHAAWINTLAFTPDGTRLISAGEDREIKIWDPVKQREILSLAGHTNSVSAIAVTLGGRLISGSLDGTVQVCETSPLPERRELFTLTGHTNRVNTLAFDPNRLGRLVSVDQGLRGLVWDTVERRQVESFPAHFDVTFSPDGRQMISPTPGISDKEGMWVEVRDPDSPKRILTSTEKAFVIFCADISVDGDWVAGGTFDREIVIWNRKTGIKQNVLGGHRSFLTTLRFSPTGGYLVSVGVHGETLRWDATRLAEPQQGVQLLPPTAVREFSHIGFSPDGQRLATGDGFDGIFILNVKAGEKLRHIPRAHGGIVLGVKFSPDGRRLASCGMDNVVRLWNAETGEALRTFIGHTASVYDVAFSPDGRMLASCGLDQTVKLWEAIDSVAVMPFVNASGDPNREYLSDGITESLIDSLSQSPNLEVKSRDSAFRYKGRDTDSQTIGRELGVRAIFKGRITEQGDTLAISAELTDTRSDTRLWGEQYTSKAADIPSLPGELAREMTMALRLHLTGEEETRVVKRYTANPEAYQDYLQGRYWMNRSTEEGFRKGVDYFQRAIAKDPHYALAYSGLALCQKNFALIGMVDPREPLSSAREAALKALELDDTIPEAHAVIGWIKAAYDWDWSGGEKELQRAIVLDPNDANTRIQYALVLKGMGKLANAITENQRALELDPLSMLANLDLSHTFHLTRRYEESIRRAQKALESDPDFIPGHAMLCLAYLQQSLFEQGIAEIGKAVAAFPNDTGARLMFGYACAMAGRESEARSVLDQVVDLSKRSFVSPTNIALIFQALGEKDRAFEWLEKAYADRSILTVGPFSFAEAPAYDPLRSDPRFADLLRRMNLEP
ncbi:MAG: protein kinase [Verrucomicrobia bacterium]|nr:protein kinase [Verrucomicrobiota bacterium]